PARKRKRERRQSGYDRSGRPARDGGKPAHPGLVRSDGGPQENRVEGHFVCKLLGDLAEDLFCIRGAVPAAAERDAVREEEDALRPGRGGRGEFEALPERGERTTAVPGGGGEDESPAGGFQRRGPAGRPPSLPWERGHAGIEEGDSELRVFVKLIDDAEQLGFHLRKLGSLHHRAGFVAA